MANPILKITDGTTVVDLLDVNAGLILNEWRPTIPNAKGGGVYRESVMSDGRQLLMRRFENATETFNLRAHAGSQDTIIMYTQNLLRLLQKGVDYWENRWVEIPVWLEARGSNETETRYAVIHNYAVDNIDNPYAQPFFSCKPGMETLNLAIERGHWMSSPPTDPLCVPVTGGFSNDSLVDVKYVTQGESDGYIEDALGAGSYTMYRTATTLKLGIESDTDEYSCFMRIGNPLGTMDVPQGANIIYAYLELQLASAHSASNDIQANIYIEDNIDPDVFSDYDDYTLRRWYPTPNEVTIDGGAQSAGYDYQLRVDEIVQYIVDQSEWAGGGMAFKIEFIDPVAPGNIFDFASYENSTYDEPRIVIYYGINEADEDECQTFDTMRFTPNSGGNESEIFVAPRFAETGLTHIYYYDASGPSWYGNLLDVTPPYELFPPSPAVNDIVYFGSDQSAFDGGAFYSIVFDFLSGFDPTTTIEWYVYLGAPTSGWHLMTPNGSFPGVRDNTDQFRGQYRGLGIDQEHSRLEGRSVHFSSLQGDEAGALHGNWEATTVNSVLAYWVYAKITAYGSGNVEVKSHPYAITWPKLSINNGDINGDMPALGRLRMFYEGYISQQYSCNAHRMLLGLRTRYPYRDDKRGFSAYIPLQDTFEQRGIKGISLASNVAFTDHSGASNGRAAKVTPSGAGTYIASVSLDMAVYRGKYRCFVRAAVYGGTGSDVSAYIKIGGQWGLDYESKTVSIKTKAVNEDPNWFVIDFGLINLPAGSRTSLPDNDRVGINIYIVTDSGTPVIYLESLILLPADEWIGEIGIEYVGSSSGLTNRWQYFSFDSLTDLREDFLPIAGEMNQYSYEALSERVDGKSAGSFIVSPNTDIDMWILPIGSNVTGGLDHYHSYPQMDFKARLEVLERYQGMRGNR